MPGDDVGALAEVAENLHRRELSVIERAELLDRWVKLREIRKEADAIQEAADHAFGKAAEVSRELRAKPSGGRPESGIRKAARELGLPETNLRQAVKIAGLSSAAKDAARSHKVEDNQKALLAAAKQTTPEAQVAAIEKAAKADPKRSPDDLLIDRLVERWPYLDAWQRKRLMDLAA